MNMLVRLLEHAFNIFTMLFLVRILLQLAKADFYNPIAQLIHKVTAPLVNPLRAIVADLGRFNLAAFIIALALILIKFYLFGLYLTQMGGQPFSGNVFAFGVLVGLFFSNGFSIAGLVVIITNMLLVLFLGLMITSFMSGGQHHPAVTFFHQVTRPILRPVQKIVPPIGGTIDLSPMIVLLALFFIQNSLIGLGAKLFA